MDQDYGLATPADLMKRYGRTAASLAQDRYRGTGPRYFTSGKRVFYRWADVLAWEESRMTTQSGRRSA